MPEITLFCTGSASEPEWKVQRSSGDSPANELVDKLREQAEFEQVLAPMGNNMTVKVTLDNP